MKTVTIVLIPCVCILSMATAQNNEPQTSVLKMERRMYGKSLTDDEKSSMRRFLDERLLRLAKARKLYQEGKFSESTVIYETILALSSTSSSEKWEVAEAYSAAGNENKALEWYRKSVYQTVTFQQMKSLGSPLSPSAVFPHVASLQDAIERFPNQEIEVWADQSPLKLGRFAILLAHRKEYAEAIAVYQQAWSQVSEPGWKAALELDNLSAQNFDSRRFVAAAHALSATGYSDNGIDWDNLTRIPVEKGRADELDQALRVKPDFAPALYMKADIIARLGYRKTKGEYTVARDCLNKAEQYARSNELRSLIQKLRVDQSEKLR